jgi:hypothetical protein
MSITLENISSAKRNRAPRIIILGPPGIGKSEFASQSDDAVFLPVEGEEGIDAIDIPAFPVITTYKEAMESIGALRSGGHSYRSVVMDSTSSFGPIVDDAAMKAEGASSKAVLGGGWGRQWDTILNLWRDFLKELDVLRNDHNMISLLIGHVKIKASRDPDSESYDEWVFDIDSKVADLLFRWADCVLFMNRKTKITKGDAKFGKKEKKASEVLGGQRYLFTQGGPTRPGKTRGCFGDLPSEIALPRHGAWEAFMEEVSKVAQ